MIKQSPESAMPEPYKTYVRQRSETIASVLDEIFAGVDIQLCPRAITIDEQIFFHDDSFVYGTVVKNINDGYKSILYNGDFGSNGAIVSTLDEAKEYAGTQIMIGNRVRLKDPRESDGKGQATIESVQELPSVFDEIMSDNEFGCVLMPHMNQITQRVSVGQLRLGKFGKFRYLGRESVVMHSGQEVYGGTQLGLFHDDIPESETATRDYFNIPQKLLSLGKSALDIYSKLVINPGRVSVDVVQGYTDNGQLLEEVIDITPRMGGTTPAEVLALRAIYKQSGAVCIASSELIYEPESPPTDGINFIDTDDLVINAKIHELIK